MYVFVELIDWQPINVLFEISANPELTRVDVKNRVPLALPQPPQPVSEGIQFQKKSNAFIVVQVAQ
ncbi:hypothetical protein [Cupriavidus metallidurans]|jgi:tRNA(Ile2) C34 agmatinyltransferase TiaS|uniref:Uncharacterized protein n=1 Tax=Cupriavidus metallidurans TaxID=119219 RepID=A0A482J321_9BURK|nr:hypothetical protein [Cupriavidus metallidurans]QBP13484.1 hypothetical protein DDF84_028160 [Cupriavidus metallidurans]